MTGQGAKLGESLRAVRKRLGLTMSEVSRRTGLAISTLSKVESERMSLTYDKLVQLANGLGVDMAELFAPSARAQDAMITARRSINRTDDGIAVTTPNYDHLYLSADVSGKKFIPILVECTSRRIEDFPDFVRHAGEEFIYVLEGAVEVHTEFYRPVVLTAGESMWLDSKMGHLYLAHGEGRCRVVAVCSGPENELMDAVSGLEAKKDPPAASETRPRAARRSTGGRAKQTNKA